MNERPDSATDSAPVTSHRRICLVGNLSGGDSTATAQLAELLAGVGVGHQLTILLPEQSPPEWTSQSNAVSHQQALRVAPGIDLVELPQPRGITNPCAFWRLSYAAYLWLCSQSFDVICFPERNGIGFHSLSAKSLGLAFPKTLLVVMVTGPSLLQALAQQELVIGLSPLRRDFMERQSVARADLVIAPDQAMLSRLRHEDWPLPAAIMLSPPVSEDRSDDNQQRWQRIFSQTPLPKRTLALPEFASRTEQPLVSVCLVHFNRPRLLQQALDSLRGQDYHNFEVILVDDGSTDPEALTTLQQLETEFTARGWRLLRQQNRYLGAARNTAAHMARGEYLLFMDDDNVAKPHELRTLVAVAEHSCADLLTCHLERFASQQSPLETKLATEHWGPLGMALAVGLVENVFGDANSLIRRRVFQEVGGFTELRGVGHEDWEFFARASLKGYRLEVVPESLFYYRVQPGSMLSSSKRNANLLRSASPYLEGMPPWLRQVMLGFVAQHLALYQPSGGQPVLTEAEALTDEQVLLLKNRVYDALRPYPRMLNLLRHSAQAVLRIVRR